METKEILISESPEIKLHGVVLRNPVFTGRRPVLLVIHGWTSSMERYSSRIAPEVEMGYVVVLFDLRGHGKTGGDLQALSIHDHLNDCLAAYDFAVNLEQAHGGNISVFGSSYGGYLASLLSAQRTVDHLVLNVPASYPDSIFDIPDAQRGELTDPYRERVLTPNDDRALKALSDFRGDVLLIEAEHDEQVHRQVMKNIRNAVHEGYDYKLIEGADHAMRVPGANEARVRAMAEWFEKISKKTSSTH